jgi:hypothetical protein
MFQLPNYTKMFAVIEETFAMRNDPDQLQVTEKDQKKLQAIHPATLSELANEDGPLIWVLLIPTTKAVMDDFVSGKISEREVLENTEPGQSYNTIYLCSVTALPEVRGKGESKKLCLKAIESIRNDHSVQYLFTWPFTEAGRRLAQALGKSAGLPVLERSIGP